MKRSDEASAFSRFPRQTQQPNTSSTAPALLDPNLVLSHPTTSVSVRRSEVRFAADSTAFANRTAAEPEPHRTPTQWLLAAALALWASAATAGSGEGLHFGIELPIGLLDASFNKTVDNRASETSVPQSRRTDVLHEATSGHAFAYGTSAWAGFHWPLGDSGLRVGMEAEIGLRDGKADDQFDGVGSSPGRNQLGELWPDQWQFKGNRRYGASLTVGGSPPALRSMKLSLHARAGYRWLDGKFTNQYLGCLHARPCSAAANTPDFASGTDRRNANLKGWTVGLGAERALSARLALRIEARHTHYGTKRWNIGVRVPVALNVTETEVALGLIWHP